MSTLSKEDENKIHKFLQGKHIPAGLGNKEAACSVAAINLALSGELKDSIPDCMSSVVGRWIINVQDAMPDDMRNSKEWRDLLPFAAGTGRDHERERLAVIQDWLYQIVLPSLQDFATDKGFGKEWQMMCEARTASAARSAADLAAASAASAASAAASAASAASAARSAAYSAYSAASAARSAAYSAAWKTFDPVQVLRDLVAVGQ